MNLFEGSRRIAVGAAFVYAAGCIFLVASADPTVTVDYTIPNFGEQPIFEGGCSSDHDAKEFATVSSGNGKSIWVAFCFKAIPATDGSMLIPFRWTALAPRAKPNAGEDLSWLDKSPLVDAPAKDKGARAKQKPQRTPNESEKWWEEFPVVKETTSGPVEKYRSVDVGEKYSPEVGSYKSAYARSFSVPKADIAKIEEIAWKKRLERWKEGALALFGGLFSLWVVTAFTGWVVRGFMGIPRGKDSRNEN